MNLNPVFQAVFFSTYIVSKYKILYRGQPRLWNNLYVIGIVQEIHDNWICYLRGGSHGKLMLKEIIQDFPEEAWIYELLDSCVWEQYHLGYAKYKSL